MTRDVAGPWGSARAGEIVLLDFAGADHDPGVFVRPGTDATGSDARTRTWVRQRPAHVHRRASRPPGDPGAHRGGARGRRRLAPAAGPGHRDRTGSAALPSRAGSYGCRSRSDHDRQRAGARGIRAVVDRDECFGFANCVATLSVGVRARRQGKSTRAGCRRRSGTAGRGGRGLSAQCDLARVAIGRRRQLGASIRRGAVVSTVTLSREATVIVSGCPATRSPATRSGNHAANSGRGWHAKDFRRGHPPPGRWQPGRVPSPRPLTRRSVGRPPGRQAPDRRPGHPIHRTARGDGRRTQPQPAPGRRPVTRRLRRGRRRRGRGWRWRCHAARPSPCDTRAD